MTTTKIIFFVLAMMPALGQAASPVTAARETSLRHLLIPFFKVKVGDSTLEKFWNNQNSDIQEALLKAFTEKSAIEPVLSIKSFDFESKPEVFVAEGEAEGSDGILLGEYHESDVTLILVSGLTGRTLDKLKISLTDKTKETKILAGLIADTIIARLRYSGFVTATHNSEAKINLGRKNGIKEGDALVLFDFDGSQPQFSNHIHRVGVFRVNKVVNEASLGSITAVDAKIGVPIYTKVFIPRKTQVAVLTKIEVKSNNSFWISVGVSGYSLASQVAGASTTLQARSVQVPMSPAGKLGLGYARFALDLLYSGASNSSNSLGVIEGTALFKINSPSDANLNYYTSLGLFISQEQVTPTANPTTLLTSSLTYSPEFQEMLKYRMPTSFITAAFDAYFPIFSNDSLNGGATATGSYGAGLELAWRYLFTEKWAVDLNLLARYLSLQNQNGKITQTEFQVGPRLFYNF